MRPYVIWIYPYRNSSAGIRVMHRLCHELRQRGQEAYVYPGWPNPDWNEAWLADPREVLARDAIAVYPEVVSGNLLGASRVARYILNVPGLLGGDKQYDPAEMLFCYSPCLREYVPSDDRILNLPVIEPELFNAVGAFWQERRGVVNYQGKGRAYAMPGDTTTITWQWPETRREVAELLRRAEWFVTSDTMTALTTEARLCGCPTVLLPDGHVTREQWQEWGGPLDGLAWGNTAMELERARETVGLFPAWYYEQVAAFPAQMERFIEVTQGEARL